MFVQVTHDVLDRGAWEKVTSEWQGPPPGLKLHTSVTTQDGSKIFCLWEVESVAALSNALDEMSTGILKNTYYPIDEKAPLTELPREAVSR